MANEGKPKRIQERVLEMVNDLPCATIENNFNKAVEQMALFCKKNKKEFKEWCRKKQK